MCMSFKRGNYFHTSLFLLWIGLIVSNIRLNGFKLQHYGATIELFFTFDKKNRLLFHILTATHIIRLLNATHPYEHSAWSSQWQQHIFISVQRLIFVVPSCIVELRVRDAFHLHKTHRSNYLHERRSRNEVNKSQEYNQIVEIP